MISPTIGRVMWFWPVASERGAQPYASMVTYVHDDNMVNLAVFNTDGALFPAGSVAIVQDGGPWLADDLPYAAWPTRSDDAKVAQPPAATTENDPAVPAQSPSADDNILPAAGNSTL